MRQRYDMESSLCWLEWQACVWLFRWEINRNGKQGRKGSRRRNKRDHHLFWSVVLFLLYPYRWSKMSISFLPKNTVWRKKVRLEPVCGSQLLNGIENGFANHIRTSTCRDARIASRSLSHRNQNGGPNPVEGTGRSKFTEKSRIKVQSEPKKFVLGIGPALFFLGHCHWIGTTILSLVVSILRRTGIGARRSGSKKAIDWATRLGCYGMGERKSVKDTRKELRSVEKKIKMERDLMNAANWSKRDSFQQELWRSKKPMQSRKRDPEPIQLRDLGTRGWAGTAIHGCKHLPLSRWTRRTSLRLYWKMSQVRQSHNELPMMAAPVLEQEIREKSMNADQEGFVLVPSLQIPLISTVLMSRG